MSLILVETGAGDHICIHFNVVRVKTLNIIRRTPTALLLKLVATCPRCGCRCVEVLK